MTYLPTILMNLINQATNYITGDSKYDLIYTVNITCMMVLATVYLSVSASLPTTADIKPVEIWLLFNLAYPFLVILGNIVLQVKHNSIIILLLLLLTIFSLIENRKRSEGREKKRKKGEKEKERRETYLMRWMNKKNYVKLYLMIKQNFYSWHHKSIYNCNYLHSILLSNF